MIGRVIVSREWVRQLIILISVLSSLAGLSRSAAAAEKVADVSYKVGMTFRSFRPPDPYNWRGAQTHTLNAVVSFPAQSISYRKPCPGTWVEHLRTRKGGTGCEHGRTASEVSSYCDLARHGWQWVKVWLWLGEALAAHGYIAAAVNHPATMPPSHIHRGSFVVVGTRP